MQTPPSAPDSRPAPHRQFRFANFLLDKSRGVLMHDGQEVPLRKQAYEMLVLLLEHQGELVSKDFLMDAIWSDTVVTENSITQCLKEVRHAIGDDDRSIIRTVPRRGLIFELPVERIEPDAASTTKTTTMKSRWLIGAAVAASLIAALAWWALDNPQPEEATVSAVANPPPANSLAVLPFVNMSPDPEVSYLADGVSEEILNQLAQIPNLLVIARTSSFTFRDPDVDIATIGQQLNVAHVLEGSVRIEDNMARVTAQLVRTDDQTHLWSQAYDRPLDKIFDLQKGIAQDVAQQLHVKLVDAGEGNAQSAHEPNAEAYEAYLRGQYLMARRTPESVAGAADEFSRATEHDPNYAAAHAGLALALRFQSDTQYGEIPKAEALARARPHAERALELDPNLAEAHAAVAYVLLTHSTFDQAMSHLRRAVALNPNYAEGTMWLAQLLGEKGNYKESFALLERAVRSDPLSMVALSNYSNALMARGRDDEAEKVREKLELLSPRMARHVSLSFQGLKGQWAQAALTALALKRDDETRSAWRWLDDHAAIFMAAMGLEENALAMAHSNQHLVYQLFGRHPAAIQEYRDLQTAQRLRPAQEWLLGRMLAATGDYELALPYLEESWSSMDGVVSPPWFDASAAVALISARSALGHDPGTEVLATALQESARRYREAGFVACELFHCVEFEVAVAEHLAGDHESAVGHMARAVERGYVIPPNVDYLQFLYEDPEMAPVFKRQREYVLAQQREFLGAICPDNPFAEVWQPLEGTCEAYLAENASEEKPPDPEA